jgi:acyl carrier protein
MKINDFLTEISEELELDDVLAIDAKFQEMEEWDSMGVMILIGYVSDNFDVVLTANDLKELPTFEAIVNKIGNEKFD